MGVGHPPAITALLSEPNVPSIGRWVCFCHYGDLSRAPTPVSQGYFNASWTALRRVTFPLDRDLPDRPGGSQAHEHLLESRFLPICSQMMHRHGMIYDQRLITCPTSGYS